jgi:membrane protein CcdC involved in cytochrome C biogenesis
MRMKSDSANAGSLKKLLPPWFSSTRICRWMVPTVVFETLPY